MLVLSFATVASGLLSSATTPVIWEITSRMKSEDGPSITESLTVPVAVSQSTAMPHPLAIIPLASSAWLPPATQSVELVSTAPLASTSDPTPHVQVIIPIAPFFLTSHEEPRLASTVSPSETAPHPLAIIPLISIEPLPHAVIPLIPSIPELSIPEIQPVPATPLLTVTETSTVIITPTETLPAPSSSPAPSPYRPITQWNSPACLTDLDAFNITKFSGGRRNLRIVAAANGDPDRHSSNGGGEEDEDGCTPLLRLFYPAGSINPAQRPVGGTQFYAVPLDLRDARSASLEYSVFFPDGFDFVLGGKLPGIYGGRMGCSGGNAAVECFSTRLMWRRHGMGELYMYAPREEQTENLCSDPGSVCGTPYGFSIGRGSFTWATGAWTKVRQTVTLNTPGKPDGAFVLEVNGERVIERNDIFYRYAPRRTHQGGGEEDPDSGLGGILGPLLSDLIPRGQATETEAARPTPILMKDYGDAEEAPFTEPQRLIDIAQKELGMHVIGEHTATSGNTAVVTPMPRPQQHSMMQEMEAKPVGFEGLFFSTFFGGHDDRYATPRDQYVWFRGFAMSKNV